MKVIHDYEMERWLKNSFTGKHEQFDWDDGNKYKSLKHRIKWEDIEGLFDEPTVFEGRIVEPAHPEPRYLLLGKLWNEKTAALIFTRRAGQLRPISCRPARKKERIRYEECA